MTIHEAQMGKKKTKLKFGTNPMAKPRSEVSLAPCPWDMGASGQANRVGLVIEDRPDIDTETGKKHNPNNRKGVRRQLWVDVYLNRGKLTLAQVNAARSLYAASHGRLRDDPLMALKVYGSTIDRGASEDPLAAAVDARRDFHRMWGMIPEFAKPVIERVVLDDQAIWPGAGLTAWERHMDRLSRGLQALRDAMDGRR